MNNKLRIIDRATEHTTKSLLPNPPLFSSLQAGWHDLFLEYHAQPSGEHEEVAASGHSIAIFTRVAAEGKAERSVDGQRYRHSVRAEDILIIPANIGIKACWQGNSEFILLGFHPEFSWFDRSIVWEKINLIPQIGIKDPLILQMGLALKKALNYNAVDRLYIDTMANALLLHLIANYSTQKYILPRKRGGLSQKQLRRVIDYIEANLDRFAFADLNLTKLAELVEISPHYFVELFKLSTGYTPHQYVIRSRVNRAKILLSQPDQSIADISHNVGFANQSHLNLHFKRLVGMTPKQFRQQFN
jgi:AraC family transcriptional regulator